MSDASNFKLLQHSIYHSLCNLVCVVTVVSSLLLALRLRACQPRARAQVQAYIGPIIGLSVGILVLWVFKAIVAGANFDPNQLTRDNGWMFWPRLITHVLVSILAVLNLICLSYVLPESQCQGEEKPLWTDEATTLTDGTNKVFNPQMNSGLLDVTPEANRTLMLWVAILSLVSLFWMVQHLAWAAPLVRNAEGRAKLRQLWTA